MPVSVEERLEKFLSDAYSMEQQALVQMRSAPDIAGAPTLAQHFREHLIETERQADMVRERLEAVGGSPSRVKDAVMRLGGKGFLLFARVQPDTPGKLAAHAYSYEALEMASYEMLIRSARMAFDEETVRTATAIREQEREMRDRLAGDFDEAADASLLAAGKEARDTIDTYLSDAHALETQSIPLLERGEEMAGDPELARLYEEHLAETRAHARMIEERLDAMGDRPSVLKDVGLRLGGLNWSFFFQAQGDTPAKLAAFVYAVEHLEAAGYELLRRVANLAGDATTIGLAERILEEERAMADRVAGAFDRAFQASVAEG